MTAVATRREARKAATLESKAEETARLLGLIANPRRLMILCKLVGAGEMSVGAMAEDIGLSQSALSQHLALMRADGLVGTRREAQTIYYRITDPRAAALLAALEGIFCAGASKPGPKSDTSRKG